jgi:N-acetylmuramoyl-L-alanine amidase
MLIIIDPGHGGQNPGAVHGGVKEKDINLLLARQVAAFLPEYQVILTRQEDVTTSLAQRVKVANDRETALFISLHSNAGGGHGFESFVHPRAGEHARKFRSIIHDAVMATLRPYSIRDRGQKEANFYVLRETRAPALLLESLFLDNPRERGLMQQGDFRTQLAQSIAGGIREALRPVEAPRREIHTVQVGAYWSREGALACQAQARLKGFHDAFIVTRRVPSP